MRDNINKKKREREATGLERFIKDVFEKGVVSNIQRNCKKWTTQFKNVQRSIETPTLKRYKDGKFVYEKCCRL